MKPGPRNLITDVPGLRVGNTEDHQIKTGTTVLLGEAPMTAAVHVMGGAPGTRETELLAPDKLVQQVEAICLSGGSAFGLDAAGGVMEALREMGRGFEVAGLRVPIVPGAIIFDLANGGDKAWKTSPYFALGKAAVAAAREDFAIGTAGAGTGATTKNWKGGLGSASLVLSNGITVGALVVVNPLGSVTVEGGPHFWAAPFEQAGEFGGKGVATRYGDEEPRPGKQQGEATTIAIIATDANLTKGQCQRLATAAHDGMARAIVPSHTPFDGDLVFAVSTGAKPLPDPIADPFTLGHAAATVLARAIARAVYEAAPAPGDRQPCYRSHHG
ncbi:P1 family peptidase [Falsigemmobacter intermedius]|uniref:Peptidase S58 family protein n=1 Tax=Falsigemmobacter intermedius TaxID=1553448 RepID=A0A444MER6_9RHOB|nr:P1 family peptidase [Falsigemmobacter intermedius]RWY43505.1 peptidase S58 family protein [Falsigemmobacter intermedius]